MTAVAEDVEIVDLDADSPIECDEEMEAENGEEIIMNGYSENNCQQMDGDECDDDDDVEEVCDDNDEQEVQSGATSENDRTLDNITNCSNGTAAITKDEFKENIRSVDLVENDDKDDSDEPKPKYIAVQETEIPDEETGFPGIMKNYVTRGKCIPINKKTWTEIDIDGNDAILDCASQIVPLMIKKPDLFPEKLKDAEKEEEKTRKRRQSGCDEASVDEDANGTGDVKEEEEVKEEENNAAKSQNNRSMLTIPDFYKSSVGNLLIGLGLSRAKEWYHKDTIRQLHRAIRKEGEDEELVDELKKQQQYYNQCKAANSIFTFKLHKCHMCEFKTESETVLEGHYAIPHLSNRKEYRCNYCLFLTRDARTIIFHFESAHKKPCVTETPPQLYECPTCPYESSQKQKAANHFAKCAKIFNAERVCYLPDPESEYPTITPKLITQEDIKVYEATLQALRPAVLSGNPQAALPNIPGLPRGLQYQMLVMQQQQLAQQTRNMRAGRGMQGRGYAGPASVRAMQGHGNVPYFGGGGNFAKTNAPQLYNMLQSGAHTQLVPVQHRMAQGANTTTHLQAVRGRVVAGTSGSLMVQKGVGGKPNILGKTPAGKDGQTGKGGTFVICEICDGYIKDLEQLRTHMQWIHKVKIHPKMLASRPPLNCQKCQWRFFTDQGLERHLLGAHGLVTSNMQDMVDQNQDGGRCTICGRVFANKLVAHMNQVHKITLRPAHLSYKCTVCSATFNLYRLFENHVYMVHSGSVKRNNADK